MPTVQWPPELPTRLRIGSSVQFQQNLVSFEPAVGPALVRQRATAAVKTYDVTIPLDGGRGQPERFIAFYENDMQHGANPVAGLRDPFGRPTVFRLRGQPNLTEANNGYWELRCQLEEVLA